MPKITIGTGERGDCKLDIPRLIVSRALVTADSGGGKSYLLRKILEEVSATTQTIVIDPEGEFASLREIRDMVLVGEDGDLPAEPASAGLLVRRLMELHLSAVIDIEPLTPRVRQEFVANFCFAMVALPRPLWHPCIVAIDEIHDFAPENAKSISGEAVASLSTKGRKRGFCLLGATQRLSKLANDVAAGLKNNFLGTFSLDTDIKRAAGILGFGKDRWTEIRDLSSQKGGEGEFYAFGPALNHRGVEKIRGGEVRTTHPKAGMGRKARPPAPSAKIKEFLGELKDIPVEAKQQIADLAAAQQRIAELERRDAELSRIAKLANNHGWDGVTNSKILHVFLDQALRDAKVKPAGKPAANPAIVSKLRKSLESAMKTIEDAKAAFVEATAVDRAMVEKAIRGAVETIAKMGDALAQDQRRKIATMKQKLDRQIDQIKKILGEAESVEPAAPISNGPAPVIASPDAAPVEIADGLDVPIDKNPHRRIIGALVWWCDAGIDNPTVAQIGVMAGYNISGGSFTTYLGTMAGAGLITRGRGTATLATIDVAMIPEMPEISLAALHRRLLDILDGPGAKIMRALIAKHGTARVSVDQLGTDSGYSASGGSFGTYLGKLSGRGLIDRSERGFVRATSAVFPPGLT